MFWNDILLFGMNYLVSICFEQLIHSFAHNRKYGGQLYQWHRLHHLDYPPHKTQSKEYINSGEGIVENLFLYSILGTDMLLFPFVSYRTFLFFLSQTTLYAFTVNYFHRQYHTEDSYWNQYQWYRKKRDYHLLHHKRKNCNMGFSSSYIDKLRGMYLSPKNTIIDANDCRNPSS